MSVFSECRICLSDQSSERSVRHKWRFVTESLLNDVLYRVIVYMYVRIWWFVRVLNHSHDWCNCRKTGISYVRVVRRVVRRVVVIIVVPVAIWSLLSRLLQIKDSIVMLISCECGLRWNSEAECARRRQNIFLSWSLMRITNMCGIKRKFGG